MSNRFPKGATVVAVLSLSCSVTAWGGSLDVIAPKEQQPAVSETKESRPEVAPTNPCPEETGWLLSTVPLTNTEKKDTDLSRNTGNTFLPEDMQKELMNFAVKENISLVELCGKLKKYKSRLDEYNNDPQEYNRQRMLILEEMLDCKKSCGQILNKFARLYTESSRHYYAGIVRFNFGAKRLTNGFKGDKTHGYLRVNNEEQLGAALAKWQKDPSQRIQLDARSSLPGTKDINDRISRSRAESVQNWLVAQGVPESRISIKWLGKYGPLIDQVVARAYNIEGMYDDYRSHRAKQSTTQVGAQTSESFFDGLNQSVCIFVLP